MNLNMKRFSIKKYLFSRSIVFALSSSLITSGCFNNRDTSKSERLMAHPITITISSLDDLNALFAKYQYNKRNWEKGDIAVPRITFDGIHPRWAESSKKLPVQIKKSIFFQLMAPLALIANEQIRHERNLVKKSDLKDAKLKSIALKYRVIKDATLDLTEAKRQALLARVDIIPPSLTLAQAAEESGWATSRFARQGNAFFGQWDFSGKGMKPQGQRKELGNYGVARFTSPLNSVEAYMFNINTNKAYQSLRLLRTQLRAANKSLTGTELAGTLDKYSERGPAYVTGLQSIIRHNHLQPIDQAHLLNNQLIHLIASK